MKQALNVFLAVLVLFSSPIAFGAELSEYSSRNDAYLQVEPPNAFERYGIKAGTKFDYGVPNFLMGWTSIMTEPAHHRQTTGPKWKQALSAVGATGIGFGLFAIDTVGGALNILTCPVPVIIPLPRGGVDTRHLTAGHA